MSCFLPDFILRWPSHFSLFFPFSRPLFLSCFGSDLCSGALPFTLLFIIWDEAARSGLSLRVTYSVMQMLFPHLTWGKCVFLWGSQFEDHVSSLSDFLESTFVGSKRRAQGSPLWRSIVGTQSFNSNISLGVLSTGPLDLAGGNFSFPWASDCYFNLAWCPGRIAR